MKWPFAYHSLDTRGHITAPDRACDARCSKLKGLINHVRWPQPDALNEMLGFLKQSSLP